MTNIRYEPVTFTSWDDYPHTIVGNIGLLSIHNMGNMLIRSKCLVVQSNACIQESHTHCTGNACSSDSIGVGVILYFLILTL